MRVKWQLFEYPGYYEVRLVSKMPEFDGDISELHIVIFLQASALALKKLTIKPQKYSMDTCSLADSMKD